MTFRSKTRPIHAADYDLQHVRHATIILYLQTDDIDLRPRMQAFPEN